MGIPSRDPQIARPDREYQFRGCAHRDTVRGPDQRKQKRIGTFSDTLRLELHPFGIHVCTVEPGAIKTPAVEKTLGNVAEVVRMLPPLGAGQYGEMLKGFARRAYEREMNGQFTRCCGRGSSSRPPSSSAQTSICSRKACQPSDRTAENLVWPPSRCDCATDRGAANQVRCYSLCCRPATSEARSLNVGSSTTSTGTNLLLSKTGV